MLLGNWKEATQPEVQITAVSFDDLVLLLTAIHHPFKGYDGMYNFIINNFLEVNTERLLEIANFYDVKYILMRTEEFLIDEEVRYCIEMKLLFADKYKLGRLLV